MFDPRTALDPELPGGPGPVYGSLVDELRCHTTEWLRAQRLEAVREQRRWRVRELAITRVLDDRGAIDDSLAAIDGVSVRTVRATVETARALEVLPEIAGVAAAGGLSDDQLTAVTRLAEPESDAEWAHKASRCSPADLEHLARHKSKPTAEDGLRRRRARALGFWWRRDSGMLDGRFSLPDIDGALFESVINQMIEQMRPAKGQPWETRERRGADALVELVRSYADVRAVTGPTPHLLVQVPLAGPADVAGIPLPDELVQTLRAQAKIEPVLVDDGGAPIEIGRVQPVLPRRVTQAVLRRDGKCRVPGCDVRHGLRVQQLLPGTWAGADDQSNLAAVCAGAGVDHAAILAPSGPHLLLGNPNRPDGLHLVHRDDLPGIVDAAIRGAPTEGGSPESASGGRPEQLDLAASPTRAGPEAA